MYGTHPDPDTDPENKTVGSVYWSDNEQAVSQFNYKVVS